MTQPKLPRGFRNNNPLNIRKGSCWKGLVLDPSIDNSFCVFSSMRYGLRAAIYLLLKYYKLYKLHTLFDIISRWAPQSENDTWSYCKLVALQMDIPVKFIATLDLDLVHDEERLFMLLNSMIYVENGQPLFIRIDVFHDILSNDIPSFLK